MGKWKPKGVPKWAELVLRWECYNFSWAILCWSSQLCWLWVAFEMDGTESSLGVSLDYFRLDNWMIVPFSGVIECSDGLIVGVPAKGSGRVDGTPLPGEGACGTA